MAADINETSTDRKAPGGLVPSKKSWMPPAITEEDVLEAIAGACDPGKATPAACGGGPQDS